MAYIPFNQIVDALEELEPQQKQLLLRILEETTFFSESTTQSKLSSLDEIRAARFHDGLSCPHCGQSGNFKKNGTYRGRQRYLHKTCGQTFNDLTNTPIHRTRHPKKWASYLRAMEQGYSLRKCAKLVGISLQTSFEWRHKILHALSQIKTQTLEGIVEVDETYVLYSEKGKRKLPRKARKRGGVAKKRGISNEQVCVLVARDRTKHTIAEVATFGRLSAATLDQLLTSRLQSGVILCTDEEQTFRKYARDQKLLHEKVNPGKKRYVTKEIYHIQNVNAYHERFKTFLQHFRGVATKYLNHYAAYHRFLDGTTSQSALTRTRELFHQALRQPMKTTGKALPGYCESEIQKMVS
jgi:Transposase and inactivated derivatives